jgi:hypothetical protein
MMVQLARYVDTNDDLTVTLTHDADGAQQFTVTTQMGVNVQIEHFDGADHAFIRMGVLISAVSNDEWLIHNAAEPSSNLHFRNLADLFIGKTSNGARRFQRFDWRAFPV